MSNEATMDAGAHERAEHGMGETISSIASPVLSLARGAWWFGLGTAVLATEQAGRLVNFVVSRGREAEPTVTEQLKRAEENVAHVMSDVGGKLKGMGISVSRMATREGVQEVAEEAESALTKENFEKLLRRVEELAEKVNRIGG
ncbi:MAG: hypothetical protein ACK5AZ_11915 [Bryobacteraceae bacterium]